MKKIKKREEWLLKATSELRPLFRKHNATLPAVGKLMMGCGWPRGGKTEVIGQCFGKTWTSDGTTHIFISPTEGDEISVLATLVHELIHAAVGVAEGHRGRFKDVARAMGLEGKLTATYVSEKSPLYEVLKKLASGLGKYPHSKMVKKKRGVMGRDKYEWPRLVSVTNPMFTFVMSPKVIERFGVPKDSKGVDMKITWRR